MRQQKESYKRGGRNSPRTTKRVMAKILFIFQTPPPVHGQSIMLEYLANIRWAWCRKVFIRLDLSDSIKDVGRWRTRKIFKLARVLYLLFIERYKQPIAITGYAPAPPRILPMLRDMILVPAIRLCSHKVVFHFHTGFFTKPHIPAQWLLRVIYGRPYAVIVNTQRQGRIVSWLRPRNVYYVPNCTIDQYKSKHNDRLAVHNILTLSTLSDLKGIFVCLEAAKILAKEKIPFRWLFVGEFDSVSTQKNFNAQTASANLTDKIIVTGPKTGRDKWEIVRNASIFCLPTHHPHETTPLALIEALMMGIPVVTTSWRSNNEIITNSKEGYLVPVQNPSALAAKIKKLLTDRHLRSRMGNAARQKYLEQFSKDQHCTAITRIYQSLLESE